MTALKRVIYGTIGASVLCALLAWMPAPTSTPTQPVQQGVVTAVRHVPAYAAALGAKVNEWGKVVWQGVNGDTKIITRTSIFRVETPMRYYDLSKLVSDFEGLQSGYRWPAGKLSRQEWPYYERLKTGDHVLLLPKKYKVWLPASRCVALGLVVSSPDLSQPHYRSHCTYQVPLMDIHIKGFGTMTDETWTFRVVGSGPLSSAATTQIGVRYSKSLRPLS